MDATLQDFAALEGTESFPGGQRLRLVRRARGLQATFHQLVGQKRTIETQICRAPLGVGHGHVTGRDVGVNFRARLGRALLRAW
jgi:hypothetical protein